MIYTFYINRGHIGALSMLPEMPERIEADELSIKLGREIRSIFDMCFIPKAVLFGEMDREEVGNFVERLYGWGWQSVAVVSHRRKILELAYQHHRR